LLDSDIATVYGVETREINQAVKNNQDKFPSGYIFKPTSEEQKSLRSKFLILAEKGRGQHSKYTPTMTKRPNDEETWALQKMWADNPLGDMVREKVMAASTM